MKSCFSFGVSSGKKAFIACLLAVFLLSGCQSLWQDIFGGGGSGGGTSRQDPLGEARNAYATGNYSKAESLAQKLSKRGGVSPQTLNESLVILSKAASRNKHPNVALDALDRLRLLQPGVEGTTDWQETWFSSMRQLSDYAAKAKADEVLNDAAYAYSAKGGALIFKSTQGWQKGQLGTSLPDLENFYAKSPDSMTKATLEQRLLLELYHAEAAVMSLLTAEVGPDNFKRYPYTIFQVADAHRLGKGKGDSAQATAALKALSKKFKLADQSLFSALPLPKETVILSTDPISSGAITGRPVVLALPMSGQYGKISARIVAGATAACNEFSTAGAATSLVVIDTDQPDWIGRINGLPDDAVVIGGPIRPADFSAARSQGLTSKKVFLTFLAQLDQGAEGSVGWRFFPSPSDQVNTLLRFTSDLGISGYGILFPDEPYGHRMSQIFTQRAQSMGASVIATSYEPKQSTTWLKAVGDFVGNNKNPSHGKSATFQAVFLPDTWANMDVIVPNMFYYNETKQVLLGTNLWEQGLLAPNAFASPQYYDLAVFPGVFDRFNPSPATERLLSVVSDADRWSAIGYDFARFSVNLNITPNKWTPGEVNSALSRSGLKNWSMAPISWDSQGKASQKLFLFQPDDGGYTVVDEQDFKSFFKQSWR